MIDQIADYLPNELIRGKIHRYVEPFIGGGALFFHIAQSYKVAEFYISDVNEELILAYTTIKVDINSLIDILREMECKYYKLKSAEQEEYYYKIRLRLNKQQKKFNFKQFQDSWVERTAQIIFLNKTCYNGLFRVNSNGEFNVPFGHYKKPLICAEDNLKAVSDILQRAEIHLGDFTICEPFVDSNTFVYFDPPYRPISKTASFTSYSKYDFDDAEQLRLASFYRLLNTKGAKLMLSNSDPKNENSKDNYFEDAYKDFRIEQVTANRMINCNADKRGAINELLILNY